VAPCTQAATRLATEGYGERRLLETPALVSSPVRRADPQRLQLSTR